MLSKLSIRQKIMLAMGCILFLLTTLSIYYFFELKKVSSEVKSLLAVEVQIEQDLTSWRTGIEKNIILTKAVSIIDDELMKKSLLSEMSVTSEEVNRLQAKLEKTLYSVKSKELFAAVLEQRKVYSKERSDFFKAKDAGEITNIKEEFINKVQSNADIYMSKVNALLKFEREATTKSQNKIQNDLSNFQNSLMIMSGIAILIGIVLSMIITNNIITPIKQAIAFANNIEKGNLNNSLENNSRDEIGTLVRSLQAMNESLRNIVIDVRGGSSELLTSSSEISAGNMDLSQRTEAVAAGLEEAAASVEQFTQTLSLTSENSSQASKMSSEAYKNAQSTGDEMKKFTYTMNEINQSSEKIGDIISVMEGIAFQTNILALNAAVEAARAGENGRGFSVVASEVRSLSKRSSEAAKEIKELIKNSQEKVRLGTAAVNATGKTIESLIHNIKSVSEIVSDINTANKEQSVGIRQINEVIAHIDDSTQKNAALVEESTAATESMKIQANSLNEIVNKFQC